MKFKISFLNLLMILLTSIGNSLIGQTREISGVIKSATDNLPLPGVNIVIQGTSTGTVTDVNGSYSISVQGNDAILEFSYIGYLPQELPVLDKNIIDLFLVEDIQSLSEVVVIGYGQIQKSDVTGSIASLSAEKLTERPVTSIDMALQGQASGVQVSTTSGMPGSGASIRIRGHGSLLTSNGPLWVIDGFVGADINTVAPEDIERIEILKDNSSSAIYGAKGGNGVIIVTTKQGKAGQDRVDFAHYTEFRSVIKKMDMLGAPDFMRLRNQALANDGFDPQYSDGEINLTVPVTSTGYIANTNWQDEVFRNAMANYYNLSLSGGSEKTLYAISANYKTEEGIIHFSDYSRAGINLNLTHQLTDKISFGTNIKAYMSTQKGFEVQSGSLWAFGPAGNALASMPYYPVHDSLGNYYINKIWDNPLYAAEGDVDIRKNTSAQGTFYMSYSLLEDLTIKGTLSGEIRSPFRTRFVSANLTEATQTQNLAKGLISQTNLLNWTGNIIATYNKRFANIHHFTAMVGIEQQVSTGNTHIINGTDINKESLLWYDFSAFNPDYYQPYSGWWGYAFISQFSRVSYNLMDKYLVQATLRRDGSSKFGASNKYGIFPSVSAAWKLHHEDFISNLGLFDQLKLRASWGQSGNDNINLYQWLPEISYSVAYNLAVFGDEVVHAAIINKIPNEDIGWEVSTMIDLGVDMSFLSNRLNLTLDYYDRTTSELLWSELLPLFTGYGDGWDPNTVSMVTNFAKMNNRGFELSMDGILIDSRDWQLRMNINLSTNKNMVLYLGDQSEFYTGVTKVEVGEALGNIYGYVTDGLYSIQDSVDNLIPTGYRPGDQKYLDISGDTIINDLDRTVIGNALPDLIAGFGANLSFKNWELSVMMHSFIGNDMYNGTYESIAQGDLGRTNGGAFLVDAWNRNNQDSDIPRLSTNYQSKTSDRFVEDASFLKLSNAMISYKFRGSLLTKIKVQNLRLYLSGQNLFVLSAYRGFDPETHSGGNSNLNIGYDGKNYPTFRSVTAGVNITF